MVMPLQSLARQRSASPGGKCCRLRRWAGGACTASRLVHRQATVVAHWSQWQLPETRASPGALRQKADRHRASIRRSRWRRRHPLATTFRAACREQSGDALRANAACTWGTPAHSQRALGAVRPLMSHRLSGLDGSLSLWWHRMDACCACRPAALPLSVPSVRQPTSRTTWSGDGHASRG
jgi:hypothetical protein